jgi:hypothetical protein
LRGAAHVRLVVRPRVVVRRVAGVALMRGRAALWAVRISVRRVSLLRGWGSLRRVAVLHGRIALRGVGLRRGCVRRLLMLLWPWKEKHVKINLRLLSMKYEGFWLTRKQVIVI